MTPSSFRVYSQRGDGANGQSLRSLPLTIIRPSFADLRESVRPSAVEGALVNVPVEEAGALVLCDGHGPVLRLRVLDQVGVRFLDEPPRCCVQEQRRRAGVGPLFEAKAVSSTALVHSSSLKQDDGIPARVGSCRD